MPARKPVRVTRGRRYMGKIPENFDRLHAGEESIRRLSVEAIEKSDDLALHLNACEKALDLLHYFVHRDEHRDEDDLTVRLLGIRMFNALNATLKLLLAGYYQASTLQQRDVVETVFLLDYFQSDRSLIARWRLADDKTLKEQFAPVAVRKALDARDAFTGQKRAAHYKLFSVLAGHPNPRGFQMLRLPNGLHHCGPFFDQTALQATVSETGKSAAQAGVVFGRFFELRSKEDAEIKLAFLDIHQVWLKRFFGGEGIEADKLEELRTMIERLRRRSA